MTVAWNETEERFINPYNFVEFEKECQRKNVSHSPGSLTGYMDCVLELLTPLFIPNTSNNHALHRNGEGWEAKSYNFFSYTDLNIDASDGFYQPVIPGSGIRGTVRSVFEAVFNGCMSSVEGNRPLSRRSSDAKKAGMLVRKNGNWQVLPCQRWMLNTGPTSIGKKVPKETYQQWEEGQVLYVKKSHENYKTSRGYPTKIPVVEDWNVEEKNGRGWAKGRLHKGEKFGTRKHHESVFVLEEKANPIPVTDKDLKRLEDVLKLYRDPKINRTDEHGGYSEYSVSADQEVILVYYNDGSPIYLSPACISKEVFSQSVNNLLMTDGGYQPCQERDKVCSTCALFGMVGSGSGKGSRASRIRFGDAELTKVSGKPQWSDYYFDGVVLPELGEPKPSTVEFYTFPPNKKIQGLMDIGLTITELCSETRRDKIHVKSCLEESHGFVGASFTGIVIAGGTLKGTMLWIK